MILTLAVSGYRSIRELILPLERLTIVTGSNGSGKSSLYKSIRLLNDVAQGRGASALAKEGGFRSTLWAGPERISAGMKSGSTPVQGTIRNKSVALKLGFSTDDYGYAIDMGLPQDGMSMFSGDPEIKTESLWVGEHLSRRNELANRNGPLVQCLNADGKRETVLTSLPPYESMMGFSADTKNGFELLVLRERLKNWRFYDNFRTDPDSEIRRPQVGTRTPVLKSDGTDLAAAFQTIQEIGDHQNLNEAIDDAFPGSTVSVHINQGLFEIEMSQHGLLRPLLSNELSDGTLRYLCLVVALLSPRPPELMVLNEPETSLHPSLLAPLARLIKAVSSTTQVIVVSHARELVNDLMDHEKMACLNLQKILGETVIDGVDPPKWLWPHR